MTPLLKSLLGNNPKDRDTAEEMHTLLNEMRQERERFEALLHRSGSSAERLEQLGGPIAKAEGDVEAVASRLADLEQRFATIAKISAEIQTFEERAQSLAQSHQQATSQIASTLEDTQQIRTVFEELSQKVDLATELKERLVAFLEVEKPFAQLRDDAGALRGQVENTGDQVARLREQHDRLIDAHKLAMSKMEALDRRRDELGRSLSDKERRVAGVEQAVRGVDGVQQTVGEVKREIGTLKALGDSVVQKTAALEAQRDAVERALAQAENLDRAMRQIDAGLRQQQENEKSLGTLQDQVSALRSLHETVVERSGEISQLQHEAEEQTRATRQDLASVTDEMKKTVERFDFESRGLESVTQRVTDLRGALNDCESRFKGLNEASVAVVEIGNQSKTLTAHLHTLSQEVGQVDQELAKLRAIRRDLAETARSTQEVSAQLARIEQAGPTIETALRHLDQLNGAHAIVKDSMEQVQIAHAEITRMRESQSETREWLGRVEQATTGLTAEVGELNKMAPTIEVLLKQSQTLGESMASIESRREFVEDLHRRMAALGVQTGKLDERGRQMLGNLELTEKRLSDLTDRTQEAENLAQTIADVASRLNEAGAKTGELGKAIATIASRCESVEQLEAKTRALKPELEQRHHALKEAAKDLQRASALRKEAATHSQQLEELVQRLTTDLAAADKHVGQVEDLSTQLEDRATNLRSVETRLQQFEERLAQWDPVEKEIAASLEQLASRQNTVEALQADLDRMFAVAEQTASNVREIASAHQQIDQSRKMLTEVMGRMQEVRNTADSLDERKRQLTKAEERLSRADALLVDVRSSLESLQGQKAIVDQAVEKAGSLQFLLKQAESTIEGLREEREMTVRVRNAVAVVREDDDDENDQRSKAA